jgi:hypothetical protein
MPELVNGEAGGRWPRDRRVFRTLLELSRGDSVPPDADSSDVDLVSLETLQGYPTPAPAWWVMAHTLYV